MADDALKQANEQLRTIIDTVPSYIFVKDLEGRFLLVNQAVAELCGTHPEDVVGQTDLDFGVSEEQAVLTCGSTAKRMKAASRCLFRRTGAAQGRFAGLVPDN